MEWLIIVYLVIYLLGACVINLNIIFYYANPEDSKYNHGLVAKAVSLIALEFSWLTLSITPTDAYNTRNNAGLNTAVFWHLVLTLNLCLILFPIPFAMSYYEADTDTRVTRSPRWYRAFKPSLFVLFFGAVVTVILYFALRSTQYLVCPPSTVSGENVFSIAASNGTKPECQWTATRTPFFAFSGIIFAFLGWVLVFLYLGVGFIMVPAGLILDFVTRPKPMSQDEYRNAKSKFEEEVAALKAIGEELRERDNKLKAMPQGLGKLKEGRLYRSEFNKFRQTVHLLEEEDEKLNISLHERGENPLLSYSKLVLGILSIILSSLWITHIILRILLPQILTRVQIFGFFDDFMMLLGKGNFILELSVYSLLMGYLLACVMVGCFRFNMRAFCCFSIHPMKPNQTHLNSVLFNTSVIIFAASALAEFGHAAFPQYVSNTYGDRLYRQYLVHTPFFGFFFKYHIFIWLMMIFSIVALVFVAFKPRESKAFNLARLQALRAKMQQSKQQQDTRGNAVQGFETDVMDTVNKMQNSANVLGKLAF